MDLGIKDKVVIITGGAKGIGAAIARACVAEGAIPVIIDRDVAATKEIESLIRAEGGKCGTILADMTSRDSCAKVVGQVLEKMKRVDALVNNVGANDNVSLASGSTERFVASLELNLVHYYSMAHHALPALKESRGSILNISSKTAVTGQGGTSGYVAAKGAILALTREWAAELLPTGIRVNAIVPSEVDTPLYQQWLSTFPNPAEKRAHIVSKIPLGRRMTRPEEIAAMAVFLISDRASHITGQHVYVDGGYTHLDRALT